MAVTQHHRVVEAASVAHTVVAQTGVDQVGTTVGTNRVVATRGCDRVVAGAANDRVGAIARRDVERAIVLGGAIPDQAVGGGARKTDVERLTRSHQAVHGGDGRDRVTQDDVLNIGHVVEFAGGAGDVGEGQTVGVGTTIDGVPHAQRAAHVDGVVASPHVQEVVARTSECTHSVGARIGHHGVAAGAQVDLVHPAGAKHAEVVALGIEVEGQARGVEHNVFNAGEFAVVVVVVKIGRETQGVLAAQAAVDAGVVGITKHQVVAIAARQEVSPAAAINDVVAVATVQAVVVRATNQGVVAVVAREPVVATTTFQGVIASPGRNGFCAATAQHRVVANTRGQVGVFSVGQVDAQVLGLLRQINRQATDADAKALKARDLGIRGVVEVFTETQQVVAVTAGQEHVAVTRRHRVVTLASDHAVGTRARHDAVIACATHNHIVAIGQHHGVTVVGQTHGENLTRLVPQVQEDRCVVAVHNHRFHPFQGFVGVGAVVAADDQRIAAVIALDGVVALGTINGVVVQARVDPVSACACTDHVVASACVNGVSAIVGDDGVVARARIDVVGAVARHNGLVAVACEDGVVALARVDVVVGTTTAVENVVVAATRKQGIGIERTKDAVLAGIGFHLDAVVVALNVDDAGRVGTRHADFMDASVFGIQTHGQVDRATGGLVHDLLDTTDVVKHDIVVTQQRAIGHIRDRQLVGGATAINGHRTGNEIGPGGRGIGVNRQVGRCIARAVQVALGVGHRAGLQHQGVGRIVQVGIGRERTRPGDAVGGGKFAERATGAVVHKVAGGQAAHAFRERHGHIGHILAGDALECGPVKGNAGHFRALGIERIIDNAAGNRIAVAHQILHHRRRQADLVGGVLDVGARGESGRPGDAVGGGGARNGPVVHKEITVGQSGDRLAEDRRHRGSFARLQGCRRDVQAVEGGRFGVHHDVAGALRQHILVARHVRNRVHAQDDRADRVFGVNRRRVGGRPGDAVGAGDTTDRAVFHREIAGRQSCDGLAEDRRDGGGIANLKGAVVHAQAGDRGRLGIDREIGRTTACRVAVLQQVLDRARAHADQIGRVFHIACRGVQRRPGDAVGAGRAADGAVLNRDLCIGQIRDRLAKDHRHGRGVTHLDGRVREADAGDGGHHRVDFVVGRHIARAVGITGQIGHCRPADRDHIGQIFGGAAGRKGCGPNQAIGAANTRNAATGDLEVVRAQARDGFAEGDGHGGGVAQLDLVLRQVDAADGGQFGVHRERARNQAGRAGVATDVVHSARSNADGQTTEFGVGSGGVGGIPGDAVGAGGTADRATADNKIRIDQAGHCFAEHHRHGRGFARLEGGIGQADAVDGGRLAVDAVVGRRRIDRVGIAGIVQHSAGGQADAVVGVFGVQGRREGRGPGHPIGAGGAGDGAILNREIAVGQVRDLLAKDHRHGGRLTGTKGRVREAQRGDCRRLGVDGVIARGGLSQVGIARQILHRPHRNAEGVAGIFDIRGRGQGGRPGHAICRGDPRHGAIGGREVTRGQARYRFAENDRDRRSLAHFQGIVRQQDLANGRRLGVDGEVAADSAAQVGIARCIHHRCGRQGQGVGCIFHIGGGGVQGRPGDPVGRGQVADETVVHRKIVHGQTRHGLTEDHGDDRSVRGLERAVRQGQAADGRRLGVHRIGHRAGAKRVGVAKGIGDRARFDADLVAGRFRVGGRRERGRPGHVIGAGDTTDGAIGHAEVAGFQARDGLAEDHRHRRGLARLEGGVRQNQVVDRGRLGVHGVVAGVGRGFVGIASRIGHR